MMFACDCGREWYSFSIEDRIAQFLKDYAPMGLGIEVGDYKDGIIYRCGDPVYDYLSYAGEGKTIEEAFQNYIKNIEADEWVMLTIKAWKKGMNILRTCDSSEYYVKRRYDPNNPTVDCNKIVRKIKLYVDLVYFIENNDLTDRGKE